jgi:glycosyltransferase involved in cell wall biosynthesis
MNRPVLAYVANSLDPGGTERLVVDMGLAFAAEFDVRVWTLDSPGAWASRLRDAGIPVKGLWRQPGIDLAVAAALAHELKVAGAAIVHAHQCSPWFYAALSRLRWSSPKLILEEHGRFWPEPDRPVRRAVNRALINPLTHRFVAVSRDIATRLVRYEGVSASRIEVIHNGVAPAATCDAAERTQRRAALGLAPDDVVIGTIGRFDPIKNLPMLVDALAGAMARQPRLRAVLVGDGPQRAEIEARIRATAFAQRFVLTGHRDDARALAPCFDVFALASLSEGLSVALLEAMAAGVPAVVTDVGGNTELVEDGETGWVVPSGDTAAVERTFVAAAADTACLGRFGEAARRSWETRFSFTSMIDAYRGLYRGLLDDGRRARDAPTAEPT